MACSLAGAVVSVEDTLAKRVSSGSAHLRAPPGKKVDLDDWPTRIAPVYSSKEEYQALLEQQVTDLSARQRIHYASNKYALLVIFQAMDAAGKDGAIRT
jgi:polyphosphate kinase 2 (PPK2 family)